MLTPALLDTGANAEVLSYGSATLVSAGNYNLTYLRRNLYGSVNVLHNTGAQFVRLDSSIFQMAIDPGYAGKQIFFKFCSFNIYGRALEDTSLVTAYSYTVPTAVPISGAAALIPRGAAVVSAAADQVYKNNGTDAWDSDAYSQQVFPNGCQVSWTPAAGHMMVGITTNPNDFNIGGTYPVTSYLNLDYAIETDPAGNAWGWSNPSHGFSTGLDPLLLTNGTPTDRYSVRYDGFQVQLIRNGAVLATYQTQGKTYYVKAALYGRSGGTNSLGLAVAANIEFGQLNAATPTQWLTIGNAFVNDTNAQKKGGANNYDSAVYSAIGYGTCHIAAKVNSTSDNESIGLSSTPTAPFTSNNIFALANYAWQSGSGTWGIVEGGTVISGSVASVALADVAWITYDGTNVRYYLNDPTTAVRTVAASGLTLYGFCSFFSATNAGLNSLRFGPTTNLAVVDTSGLGANASGQLGSAVAAGTTAVSSTVSGAIVDVDIVSISITTTGSPVGVDVTGQVQASNTGTAGPTIGLLTVRRDGTDVGTAQFDFKDAWTNLQVSRFWEGPMTLTITDTPSAGSHTYTLHGKAQCAGGSGGWGCNVFNATIKAREYKK